MEKHINLDLEKVIVQLITHQISIQSKMSG